MTLSRSFLNPRFVPPSRTSGRYYLTSSPSTTTTLNTLGNGTMRLIPWIVERAVSIDRIGVDVTAAGDSGAAKFRPVIYADSGSCYPGNLALDGGQLAADAIAVVEATVSAQLQAGLYWVGGVVQGVTTTQPTLRTVNSVWQPPVDIGTGTTAPTTGLNVMGYHQTSVTATPPSTFAVLGTASTTGGAARVFVRVA